MAQNRIYPSYAEALLVEYMWRGTVTVSFTFFWRQYVAGANGHAALWYYRQLPNFKLTPLLSHSAWRHRLPNEEGQLTLWDRHIA
jgi:hypothetical protein